ncbi:MAG: M23 family metallopeptidase [Rhizobiaceae bacterium]|nr:M23 family metallopeptidase [Rhizobiaceae bacterium]MCV0408326.1 M23 family metallopeptidase [Rhizobiaceae bacterium]
MTPSERLIAVIGDEPPLTGGGRAGPPDRREVSARWLSGAILTGITSSLLMGVALFAALDGREQLATPPEIATYRPNRPASRDIGPAKADRLAPPRQVVRANDRERMEVSTMLRDGDRNVVRTLPFVRVKMALAAGHTATRDYPSFDPLAVFAEDGAAEQVAEAPTGQIYGAKVDSEVSLRTVDFPIESATFEEAGDLTAAEVEEVVRNTAAILTDGDVRLASLHYVDPARFGISGLTPESIAASYAARVVEENVSVFRRSRESREEREFAEDVIPFMTDKTIGDAFAEAGYSGGDANAMVEAFAKVLTDRPLKAGTVLRIGLETRGDFSRIVRASIYDGDTHVRTVSLTDRNQLMVADAPEPNPAVAAAFEDTPPQMRTRADLPTAYDGIWRAATSYGLTDEMTGQLIKLLAADVDFQSRLDPSDRLEVFFSAPDEHEQATVDSEMLYIKASFGGGARSYYRFRMEDGTVDYFDSEGRSARQFLLRNPVPNGRFTSGFGTRRHPILGYRRMHTGVDWSAPRGTPIIASGNGTVEHAGWESGYGRQTRIRHANGYVTSYSHQSAIAKGVVKGAKVRQGQVIGYVGATGLATGNHLHYELLVNGTKVDPMRVRLPTSRVLKDAELEAFMQERDRIDELLAEDEDGQLKLANVTH